MSIVGERQKNRELQKTHPKQLESIIDTVAQKKEIFLVTMTTQIINNERQSLNNIIEDREQALKE